MEHQHHLKSFQAFFWSKYRVICSTCSKCFHCIRRAVLFTPVCSKSKPAMIWWSAISVLQIHKPGLSAGKLSTKRIHTEITLIPYSSFSTSGWLVFPLQTAMLLETVTYLPFYNCSFWCFCSSHGSGEVSSSISKTARLMWYADGLS